MDKLKFNNDNEIIISTTGDHGECNNIDICAVPEGLEIGTCIIPWKELNKIQEKVMAVPA